MAALRSRTSKFFAWILVGLLVLGLAGFGIQDVLRSSGNYEIALIGDQEITPEQYYRMVQQETTNLSNRMGAPLTIQQANTFGVKQIALQKLITFSLIDQASRDLGVSRGDIGLLESIEENPVFFDISGKFSRDVYERLLRSSSLKSEEYEKILRNELSRALVLSIADTNVKVPESVLKTIRKFLTEKRSVNVVTISKNNIVENLAYPNSDEIKDFYSENPDLFTQPITRRISYALLSPGMLLDDQIVTELEITKVFQDREKEYSVNEKRDIDRLIFSSESDALKAYDSIQSGEISFNEIVERRNLSLEDVSLGLTTEVLFDEPLKKVLFSSNQLGIYGPIKIDLGSALYRINSIFPAKIKELPEVYDIIKNELAVKKSIDYIDSLISNLNDEIAGGISLTELKELAGMVLNQLDVFEGAALPTFAEDSAFLDALESSDSYPSDIITLKDGSIMSLQLDKEIQPFLRDLEIVEAEVTELVQKDKLKVLLNEEVNLFLKELQSEEQILEKATEKGFKSSAGISYSRFDESNEFPSKMISDIFELRKFEVETLVENEKAYIVQFLESSNTLEEAVESLALKTEISNQLRNSINQDILNSVLNGLQEKYQIKINEKNIAQMDTRFQ